MLWLADDETVKELAHVSEIRIDRRRQLQSSFGRRANSAKVQQTQTEDLR